jgi:hypothetical protein
VKNKGKEKRREKRRETREGSTKEEEHGICQHGQVI